MLEVNVHRKNQGGDFAKGFFEKLLYFLQTEVVTPR